MSMVLIVHWVEGIRVNLKSRVNFKELAGFLMIGQIVIDKTRWWKMHLILKNGDI